MGMCVSFGENHAWLHPGKLSSNLDPSQVAPQFIPPLQGPPCSPSDPGGFELLGRIGIWVMVGQDALSTGSGAAPRTSWRSSKEAWPPARVMADVQAVGGAAPAPRREGAGPGGAQMCVCKESVARSVLTRDADLERAGCEGGKLNHGVMV